MSEAIKPVNSDLFLLGKCQNRGTKLAQVTKFREKFGFGNNWGNRKFLIYNFKFSMNFYCFNFDKKISLKRYLETFTFYFKFNISNFKLIDVISSITLV